MKAQQDLAKMFEKGEGVKTGFAGSCKMVSQVGRTGPTERNVHHRQVLPQGEGGQGRQGGRGQLAEAGSGKRPQPGNH